jgi:hypothetical protein
MIARSSNFISDNLEIRSFSDANGAQRSEHAKSLQQPKHDADDDNSVEDTFDLSVHGQVIIDEPKQHANDDQDDDDVNEGHGESPDKQIYASGAA